MSCLLSFSLTLALSSNHRPYVSLSSPVYRPFICQDVFFFHLTPRHFHPSHWEPFTSINGVLSERLRHVFLPLTTIRRRALVLTWRATLSPPTSPPFISTNHWPEWSFPLPARCVSPPRPDAISLYLLLLLDSRLTERIKLSQALRNRAGATLTVWLW